MRGGAQDDTYVVDNPGDQAIESPDREPTSRQRRLHARRRCRGPPAPPARRRTAPATPPPTSSPAMAAPTGQRWHRHRHAHRRCRPRHLRLRCGGELEGDRRGQCRHHRRLQPDGRHDRARGVGVPEAQAGRTQEKAFDSGKKKPAKDKHLVYYDEKKGDLWYDANGKKQKGKGDVLIAKLDPGLDLTAGRHRRGVGHLTPVVRSRHLPTVAESTEQMSESKDH